LHGLTLVAQMYHLPLLPGYGPGASVRSAVPARGPSGRKAIHARLSEAEENGYQGTYFSAGVPAGAPLDEHGFIASSPSDPRLAARLAESAPTDTEAEGAATAVEAEHEHEHEPEHDVPAELLSPATPGVPVTQPLMAPVPEERVGEAVFFEYGVVVFFGLEEAQERAVLEDIAAAGILRAPLDEADWEVEECHFEVLTLPPARTYMLTRRAR
jgi:uncharacterized Rmd1/YagE family protein